MGEDLAEVGKREYRTWPDGRVEWRARCELCGWRTDPFPTSVGADVAMSAHLENTHGSELECVAVDVRACRVCGCTDDRACPGGCSWVDDDLCSACA